MQHDHSEKRTISSARMPPATGGGSGRAARLTRPKTGCKKKEPRNVATSRHRGCRAPLPTSCLTCVFLGGQGFGLGSRVRVELHLGQEPLHPQFRREKGSCLTKAAGVLSATKPAKFGNGVRSGCRCCWQPAA